MKRRFRALSLILLLSVLFATPGVLAQTQAQVDETRRALDDARSDRTFVLSELDLAVQEYQTVTAELAELTYKVTQLYDRIESYEADARVLKELSQDRARQAYMNGGTGVLDFIFEVDSFNELITSQEVLDRAASRDVEVADQLLATQREMERLRETLVVDQERVAELRAIAEGLVSRLDDLYAAAEAEVKEADAEYRSAVQALENERRRQRLAELARLQGAAAGVSIDALPGYICPVQGGASFINDWGFPRSGGRRHKGNDMFAPRGTNLVAVADGSVRLTNSNLGGISVWLNSDYGANFYYAHLDGYPSGLENGQRVSRGQVIGFVGDSGNARGGTPHLHLQIHPGGGAAVNPYPANAAVCR
ncbi:MAG: peptidoglycan DD-metalloendopeptidase family protein [Acidimicrobiia bacterium]|nr:peptidoglycan DD-metalloendopeptidase family protein [Acidimicrobiia bacterium]